MSCPGQRMKQKVRIEPSVASPNPPRNGPGLPIGQSRPIHILLADVNINGHELAETLKPYRRDMEVVFTSMDTQGPSDALDLRATVSRVRQLLKPLKEIAVDTHWNGIAVGDIKVTPISNGSLKS